MYILANLSVATRRMKKVKQNLYKIIIITENKWLNVKCKMTNSVSVCMSWHILILLFETIES